MQKPETLKGTGRGGGRCEGFRVLEGLGVLGLHGVEGFRMKFWII